MINFDVSGLTRAVNDTVKQLADSVNESTLRKVGVAGAAVFRDAAKQNALAHVKTAVLYNSIIITHVPEESKDAVRQVYKITVRHGRPGSAFYWRFVEFGHRFVPKNKKISKRTGRKIGWKAHRRAAELEYGTASAPAYPYMRPAYESHKAAAIDAMTRTLAEQLQRNASHDD